MAQRISKKLAQRIKVLSYFYCLQLSLTCQFYVGPKRHCLPNHPQVQTSSWLTVRTDSCVGSCLFESICSVAIKLKANVLVFPGHLLTLLEIFFFPWHVNSCLASDQYTLQVQPTQFMFRHHDSHGSVLAACPDVLLGTLLFSSLNTKLIMTCWSL